MAENPELLALYAEAYGEESQEPAEPAYLNTREHDATSREMTAGSARRTP